MSKTTTPKRILALVLCLCMVLGMAPVAAMATEETATVCFLNNWKWTDVRAYYWTENENNTWPGETMTLVENDGYYDIYSLEIPANATGLVFSGIKDDGSGTRDQSPDIFDIQTGVYYYMLWDNENKVGTAPYTPEGGTIEPDPNPTTHTYTIVGAIAPGHVEGGVFGSPWYPEYTANDMVYDAATGLYSITYTNVSATGETVDYEDTWYEYKVVQDYTWDVSYNENGVSTDGINAKFDVEQDGSTVVIYFDGTKVWAEVTPPSGGNEEEILTGYAVDIGGTVTPYTDFETAMNAACGAESATLTLYQDVDASNYYFNGGNVTLDLNGKTFNGRIVVEGVNLTVTDTAETKGTVDNYGGAAFSYVNGKLIILDTTDCLGNAEGHYAWRIGRGTDSAADAGTIGTTGTEDIVLPAGCVALYGQEAVDILLNPGQAIEIHRHDWTEATCTEPKTCYLCGVTEGEALGHDWTDATCNAPKNCPVCGETEGDALGHNFGDDGICSGCGANVNSLIIINMVDSYGDGWNGNAIEVYEDGELVGIATFDDGSTATWTAGYDPEKEYELYWVEGGYSDECSFEILLAGEVVLTADEGDCEGYPDGYRFFPVCEHIYGEGDVIAPSCVHDGYTLYSCTICGILEFTDYVSALGHTKGEEEGVVTAPGCTEQGYTTYTCAVCGESYDSDYVPALGHTKDEGVVIEPTCYDWGYTAYTCTVCGESFFGNVVSALGHVLGEDGNCTVCGDRYCVPVFVAGVEVTIDNMADILGDGTASYDLATNTLTLNGFVYEGEDEGIYSVIPLNIVLIGENSITSSEYMGVCFYVVGGEINISGTGSLTIYSYDEGIYVNAMNDVDMTIGGSVTINISPANDEGIYLLGSTVDLLIKDNVKLTIGTEDAPNEEECIYIDGGSLGSVSIFGNADIHLVTTDDEGIDVGGESAFINIFGGNIYINADSEGMEAKTIDIFGGTVETYGGEGMEGICADNLTINGGTVTVGGKGQAIEAASINIFGGTVTVTEGGIIAVIWDDNTGTYTGPGAIHLLGVSITEPEGAAIGTIELEEEGTVTAILNADGTYADAFVIRAVESDVKNGIVAENGSLYYYKDGKLNYAGLIKIDGDYYYVRSNGELVVGRSYWITKTNDLLPCDSYNFDEEGKLIPEGRFVQESDGIYYYVNGVRTYAGLIKVDGEFYYVRSNGQLVTDRTYWITKTNDLAPADNYYFDAEGKMVPPYAPKAGVFEENGALYYYENGEICYGGLLLHTGSLTLEDGTVIDGVYDNAYIYVRSNGQLVVSRTYWTTKTNDNLPAANYQFDENGVMVN